MKMSKDNEKILLLEEKTSYIKEAKRIEITLISEGLVSDGEKARCERSIRALDEEIYFTRKEIDRIECAGAARGDYCSVCSAARHGLYTACAVCPHNK